MYRWCARISRNFAVNLKGEISHAKLKCHNRPPPPPVLCSGVEWYILVFVLWAGPILWWTCPRYVLVGADVFELLSPLLLLHAFVLLLGAHPVGKPQLFLYADLRIEAFPSAQWVKQTWSLRKSIMVSPRPCACACGTEGLQSNGGIVNHGHLHLPVTLSGP